jgi:hypothetical protein
MQAPSDVFVPLVAGVVTRTTTRRVQRNNLSLRHPGNRSGSSPGKKERKHTEEEERDTEEQACERRMEKFVEMERNMNGSRIQNYSVLLFPIIALGGRRSKEKTEAILGIPVGESEEGRRKVRYVRRAKVTWYADEVVKIRLKFELGFVFEEPSNDQTVLGKWFGRTRSGVSLDGR